MSLGELHPALDAGARGELAGLPLDRGAQAQLVQDAGTQLGGDPLDPLGGAVDDRRHAVELARQLGGRCGDTLLEPEHVDLQGGERLPQLVVDLAGDAGALRLAGRLEPRGQPAQLRAVTVQLGLGALALRDVLDHADEPLRRAVFRGERRYGDVGPDHPPVLAAVALLEREGRSRAARQLRHQLTMLEQVFRVGDVGVRQGLELRGVVADHLLERPVAADEAGAAIGHGDADGRLVEHRPEQRFALAQRLRGALPLDDAAQLRADVGQHAEQRLVGREGIGGKELEYGRHVGADGHWDRESGAQPRLGGRVGTGEVRVARDVEHPPGLLGGEYSARQAHAAPQRGHFSHAAERLAQRRVVVLPDRAGPQHLRLVRGHQVHVTDRPSGHTAHRADGRPERVFGGWRLVGGDGDGLQQLHERHFPTQGSLGRAALGHDRREHQPGHRGQPEKGLQQGEILGRGGGDERPEPVQRVPDRQGRDDGRRHGRAAAPKPQRGPRDHGRDGIHVRERVAQQQAREQE